MTEDLPNEVIQQFIDGQSYTVSTLGDGHINSTYQVKSGDQEIVIQLVNTKVFTEPNKVMENIRRTADHLASTDYPFHILRPIKGKNEADLVEYKGKYYRAFPLINGSRVINNNPSSEEALKAAHAFGIFASHLMNFNTSDLHHTIQGFHDFEKRLESLNEAIELANNTRSTKAILEIEKTLTHSSLVSTLSVYSHRIPQRVLHSDPKINNILFEETGKEVICVIDLDTIMPGPIFYDLSDMIRSYTNLADEDEADLTKVKVSENNLQAVLTGYLEEIKGQLTGIEWESMKGGYLLATYIQVVRFLTDYLNNDPYYQTDYEEHNLVRARNQLHLLEGLIQLRPDVLATIEGIRKS